MAQIRTNIATTLVNIMNNKQVKFAVEVVKEASAALTEYKKEKSKFSLVTGAGNIALKVIQHYSVCTWDFFDNPSEWISFMKRDFNSLIMDVIGRYPHDDIQQSDEGGSAVRIYDMNGIKLAHYVSKHVTRVDNIWVETDKAKEAEAFVRNELWKKFQAQSVVMRRNNRILAGLDNEDRIQFDVDDMQESMPSAAARKWSNYFQKTIDANVSRSLLLYGPPGTGKSTMAKTIISNLNLRSFRVKLSDIGDIDNSSLFEAIKIFQPDAIILDDLDRAYNQDDLLDTLEQFHKYLKLIIATANAVERFDYAILRPGRFDELDLISCLDDEVIRRVLGEENIEVFDDVKKWPISFIEEYKVRRQFMDVQEAKDAIIKLGKRADAICEYKGESEWDRLNAASVSSKKKKSRDKKHAELEKAAIIEHIMEKEEKEE